MLTQKEQVSYGRTISKVLRHNAKKVGLKIDAQGWVSIQDLLAILGKSCNVKITREELQYIVDNNNKKRYAISPDTLYIRAVQGHSLSVDLGLVESVPPAVLYHGTSLENWEYISKSGLKSMGRQHVHLTDSLHTARIVGSRKSTNVVVVKINTVNSGVKFYLSENDVWLCDQVPASILSLV